MSAMRNEAHVEDVLDVSLGCVCQAGYGDVVAVQLCSRIIASGHVNEVGLVVNHFCNMEMVKECASEAYK